MRTTTIVSLLFAAAATTAFAQSSTPVDQATPLPAGQSGSSDTPSASSAQDNARPQHSLEPVTQGSVTYVTGGIGEDESAAIKKVAGKYPLEILMTHNAKPNSEYMADVPVKITNAKGESVLNIQDAGPYLLLDLPAGRYTVLAGEEGNVKRQSLNVGRKHQRIVFQWAQG